MNERDRRDEDSITKEIHSLNLFSRRSTRFFKVKKEPYTTCHDYSEGKIDIK